MKGKWKKREHGDKFKKKLNVNEWNWKKIILKNNLKNIKVNQCEPL
jgi:hypothetical protein